MAVTQTGRSGDFELTFTTDALEYREGQPITAVAELHYSGEMSVIHAASLLGGPIDFGVRRLDGSPHVEPGRPLMCAPVEVSRDQPVRVPFFKSGGWRRPTADEAFYQSYFADPGLHLPAGRWELYAVLDFGPNGGDCENAVRAQVARQIVVR